MKHDVVSVWLHNAATNESTIVYVNSYCWLNRVQELLPLLGPVTMVSAWIDWKVGDWDYVVPGKVA